MVESGQISRQRIDESYRRIMLLKQRLVQNDITTYYQQQLEKSNQELMNVNAQLHAAEEKIKTLEASTPAPTKKKSKRKNR